MSLHNLVHGSAPSAAFYLNVLRGAKASRTASPTKINSDSMIEMTKKPVRPSQGAWMLSLPWASSSPSDGEPGGKPKPRKSSEVSAEIEPLRMNGRKVNLGTMAFGRRWRQMMVALETPRARAAVIYSKFRPRRNSARTRPTSEVHEKRRRRPSRIQKLGGSTEETMSKR